VGFTSLHVETLLRQDRTTLHRWDALRQVELPARPSSPITRPLVLISSVAVMSAVDAATRATLPPSALPRDWAAGGACDIY
jgi:hypothetical protein